MVIAVPTVVNNNADGLGFANALEELLLLWLRSFLVFWHVLISQLKVKASLQVLNLRLLAL